MGVDKGRAQRGRRRIRERSLFVLGLAGGFWGILLGGAVSHHKTSKLSFLAVIYGEAIVWGIALSWITYSANCLQ
jgi:uncharacterized membrane protein YsdA (DUF1294 family)